MYFIMVDINLIEVAVALHSKNVVFKGAIIFQGSSRTLILYYYNYWHCS